MFGHDITSAARFFARHRGFALTVVLVLGTGIGMSNTFFMIVNAICLRGLSIDRPDRALDVSTVDKSGRERRMSYRDFVDVASASPSLSDVAAFAPRSGAPVSVADVERSPERITGAYVTANMFRVIGEPPVAGRLFDPADEKPGAERVVILGSNIWSARYHGDRSILGQTIRVNARPALVVGIVASRSRFPNNADLWLPLSDMPGFDPARRDARALNVIARLAPMSSRAAAAGEIESLGRRLSGEHPDTNRDIRFRAVPVNDEYVPSIRESAWLAFITAGCLLVLVVCANVANLLLMQSVSRAREMAVRASLGASRGRLVGQLLLENVLLATCGGVLGLACSAAGARLLWASIPADTMPYWMAFTFDRQALVILTLVCASSVIVFGLVPALHGSRVELNAVLKDHQARATSGGETHGWTSALLVTQFALGTVFLSIVAFGQVSAHVLERQEPSIDGGSVLTATMSLTGAAYAKPESRRAFYERLEQRVSQIPGVSSWSVASNLPGAGGATRRLAIEGRAAEPTDKTLPNVLVLAAGPGYFDALGVPLVGGRPLDDRDGTPGFENAVVNQRFVDLHFAGADPIGRHIRLLNDDNTTAPSAGWLTIVGVSPSIRQRDGAQFEPVVYLPYRRDAPVLATIMIRGTTGVDAIAAALRREAAVVDPDLPLFRVVTLERAVDEARWNQRMSNQLAQSISWLAVALALIGLYAVTLHSVALRTRELAVRMALGAHPWRVIVLTLRRSVAQVAIGIVLGIGCTFGWQRLFIGTRTTSAGTVNLTDLQVLAPAVLLLVVLALVACVMPTLRAVRTDPTIVLRDA